MIQTQKQTLDAAGLMRQGYCPACGSDNLSDFFEARRLPLYVGVLHDCAEDARRAPTGDITLAYCSNCGFIHNRAFEPDAVQFAPGYEASLVHSEIFRSFLQSVAKRLVECYDIHGKSVVELGCGSGYFLRLLCELGGNRGIGIDPTVVQEGVERVGDGSVELIRDYFSDRYVDLQPDFVCCLSVFEAIPDPVGFLDNVRRMVLGRAAPIYFEVFNAFHAFQKQETWSIHYEQCNYFGLDAFAGLFKRCGFKLLDAATCYEDGQYLYVEAVPLEADPEKTALPASDHGELPSDLSEFSRHHRRSLSTWKNRLDMFSDRGARIVVWGSGGKGISFLNALDTAGRIEYVADINPNRAGKYIPGSAQRIVAPEFLTDYRPHTIVITNALYEQEIRAQVSALGLNCEFLTA